VVHLAEFVPLAIVRVPTDVTAITKCLIWGTTVMRVTGAPAALNHYSRSGTGGMVQPWARYQWRKMKMKTKMKTVSTSQDRELQGSELASVRGGFILFMVGDEGGGGSPSVNAGKLINDTVQNWVQTHPK
jgi:hypothetical protein